MFAHELGGTLEFYAPLIQSLGITNSHSLYLLDPEGHGLSPTLLLSRLNIETFAADVNGMFEKANITSGAPLVAHSTGCLVTVQFALTHHDKVSKLVLIGPQPLPLPEAGRTATYARADSVRTKGIACVLDAIVSAGTSEDQHLESACNTRDTNVTAWSGCRRL